MMDADLEPIAVRAEVAARLLSVSKPKIYELAARDDFHGAFKFGGCTLFSVEALREWTRKQCKATPDEKEAAPLLAQQGGKGGKQTLTGTGSTSSIHGNGGNVK